MPDNFVVVEKIKVAEHGQIQKILIKCHQNGHHAAILTFQENILYASALH
jgi:hypothetical protein